jgi:DnaJ-class molecular chaperone
MFGRTRFTGIPDMNAIVDKGVHPQVMKELQAILKQPYKDICDGCDGRGVTVKQEPCPKCKGNGYRLLRLL